MAIQVINIGTSANKGDGEPLRTAFDKINDNFAELSLKVTNLETGGVSVTTGDIKGSVFGDDSTLLVDGVNSTIPSANLSGALPAIDGSALTGINTTTFGGQNASYYLDYNNFTNTPTLFSGAFADLTGKPTTVAGYGITDALTSVPAQTFASLTGKPTTIAGYGITDALQIGTSATTALAGNTALFSGAFADLTSKPTTIAGYGISDAFDGAFASLTSKPSTIAGYGITDALATPGDNIALGTSSSAGTEGVGIGKNVTAGNYAQAIGNNAGSSNQGQGAVALGSEAGESDQGTKAVAIGNYAGETTQGANAIAIGEKAGQTNQAANSIVLNATGSALENTTSDSMVVKPIRNASGTHQLEYNPTTGEVTYDTLGAGSSYTDSDVDTHLNTGTAGAGEVLSWTGADYDWVANTGGISDVVSDTTPQLGGALDLNNNNITGNGNIGITGDATISGNLVAGTGTVGGLTFAGTQIASDDSTQISFQDNIEIAGGPILSSTTLTHTGTFGISANTLNINAGSFGQVNIGTNQGTAPVVLGSSNNDTEVICSGDLFIDSGIMERHSSKTGATGTVDHDMDDGHIFMHSSMAADFTANLTNSHIGINTATTVLFILTQGNTGRMVTGLEIGGVSQTIRWQNNNVPTGTDNGFDAVSFSIFQTTTGNYTVLGQSVSFGGV